MIHVNKPFNPINRSISPELEILLSPSAQNLLSSSEATRKVIPVEDRQAAMVRIGTWLTGAESLPAEGEMATLKFNDGPPWKVEVIDWGKTDVKVVKIPNSGPSNIDTRAFINLVHEPNEPQAQAQS
jgi:hypothetical protein